MPRKKNVTDPPVSPSGGGLEVGAAALTAAGVEPDAPQAIPYIEAPSDGYSPDGNGKTATRSNRRSSGARNRRNSSSNSNGRSKDDSSAPTAEDAENAGASRKRRSTASKAAQVADAEPAPEAANPVAQNGVASKRAKAGKPDAPRRRAGTAKSEAAKNGVEPAKPARAKLSPGVDVNATQSIEHIDGPTAEPVPVPAPEEPPVAKAKLAPGTDPSLTQKVPLIEPPAPVKVMGVPAPQSPEPGLGGDGASEPAAPVGSAPATGNGSTAPTNGKGVRPVKARVGGTVLDEHTPLPADANGHSNGKSNGVKARVSPVAVWATAPVQPITSGLHVGTDTTGLRMRLMREEWTSTRHGTRRLHGRPLPYFLMRQRSMRARARVGHTRATVAQRRFGGSGPVGAIIKILVVLTTFVALLFGAGAGGVAVATALFIGDLPPVTGPGALHGLQVQTTKIYDRNGIPLYDIVDEQTGRRQEVKLKDVSPLVISATIATEDASFYDNPGVDAVAIARAFSINFGGKGSSGASTITQQLVRNVNLPETDLTDVSSQGQIRRKLREMVQAVRFTQAYTKDDILEMYLNDNNYGHRAYGIEAASLTYFGKSARDLTLPEAALLAGLPQAPTFYDPFVNPDDAKARQAIVLGLMAKQGMITQQEADGARNQTLVLKPYQPVLRAPHFVYYVKKYLEEKYGPSVSEAGLVVTTTLDLRVEEAAEKVARDRIDELKQQRATNASIVVMKPGTGEILAMVGSVDYYNKAIDGQVNVATAERQPGSSFKPITYVTAFKGGQNGETGWTPATVILDTLTAFPNPGQKPYTPKNYDGKDHGWVTVRESIGNSLNIPAVKALQFAGVQQTIDTAHDMGIKGLNRGTGWYGLSLTLGGGEVTLLDMTNAYSTFANQGVEVDANPILAIEDPQGRIIDCNGAYRTGNGCSSTPVRTYGDGKGRVLDPRLTYMMSSILSDNRARTMEFGPNSPLKLSFTSAAKTGTTDDNRDSWTLGYTPDLAVGVWVGNSNNDRMAAVTGAIGAAVIWHNMMESFYDKPEFVDLLRGDDGKLHPEFVQPSGLVRDSACSNKGTVTDWFLKEALPKGCVNYKDPKTNKQLGSGGSSNSNNNSKPKTRPTPIPGIVFPTPVP